MADYYCDVCHLFDSSGKSIHHCEKCGICRVGENLKHCDKCNMCIHQSAFDTHVCVDRYDDICPLCNEVLRNSRQISVPLKCGHLIHQECLNNYITLGNYQCPICRKSIYDMSSHWEQIDNYVNMCTMPDEFKDRKCKVFCNDCEKKSETNYHFLYNKCQLCNSWNTSLID